MPSVPPQFGPRIDHGKIRQRLQEINRDHRWLQRGLIRYGLQSSVSALRYLSGDRDPSAPVLYLIAQLTGVPMEFYIDPGPQAIRDDFSGGHGASPTRAMQA